MQGRYLISDCKTLCIVESKIWLGLLSVLERNENYRKNDSSLIQRYSRMETSYEKSTIN